MNGPVEPAVFEGFGAGTTPDVAVRELGGESGEQADDYRSKALTLRIYK
jgi:hypothetical protein